MTRLILSLLCRLGFHRRVQAHDGQWIERCRWCGKKTQPAVEWPDLREPSRCERCGGPFRKCRNVCARCMRNICAACSDVDPVTDGLEPICHECNFEEAGNLAVVEAYGPTRHDPDDLHCERCGEEFTRKGQATHVCRVAR